MRAFLIENEEHFCSKKCQKHVLKTLLNSVQREKVNKAKQMPKILIVTQNQNQRQKWAQNGNKISHQAQGSEKNSTT